MTGQLADNLSRGEEIHRILGYIKSQDCCSIVGISNIGKSTLLRAIAEMKVPEEHRSWLDRYLLIYVDFNNVVESSEQGFCELIVRSMTDGLADQDEEITTQLAVYHQAIISPSNRFAIRISFTDCICFLLQHLDRSIVLLLDEFDELYATLPPHIFLNLRALRDEFGGKLCYVVATDRELLDVRTSPELYEFYELFAQSQLNLGRLNEEDSRALITSFARRRGRDLTGPQISFVLEGGGGHPGLLRAVCGVVCDLVEDWDPRSVGRQLRHNTSVAAECSRLWGALSLAEKRALKRVADGRPVLVVRDALLKKALIYEQDDGTTKVFGTVFEDFVLRQQMATLEFDERKREVWVEGNKTQPLSQNEYRLWSLLFDNMESVVSKDAIAEAVWPDWSHDVDDAAIENLIKRLRDKIEPNPRKPQYIVTLRGQGYKLTLQKGSSPISRGYEVRENPE